jgi:hypothetical protein
MSANKTLAILKEKGINMTPKEIAWKITSRLNWMKMGHGILIWYHVHDGPKFLVAFVDDFAWLHGSKKAKIKILRPQSRYYSDN